jgi:hypothetical protein
LFPSARRPIFLLTEDGPPVKAILDGSTPGRDNAGPQWHGRLAREFRITGKARVAAGYLVNLAIVHAPNPRPEPMQFDTAPVLER